MTDPTNIPHITTLKLIVWLRLYTIDSSNHPSNDWQRVLAKLLIGLNKKSFMVNIPWIALKMQAKERMIAIQSFGESSDWLEPNFTEWEISVYETINLIEDYLFV